jgi:hypothetical protein
VVVELRAKREEKEKKREGGVLVRGGPSCRSSNSVVQRLVHCISHLKTRALYLRARSHGGSTIVLSSGSHHRPEAGSAPSSIVPSAIVPSGIAEVGPLVAADEMHHLNENKVYAYI